MNSVSNNIFCEIIIYKSEVRILFLASINELVGFFTCLNTELISFGPA